jgi:deazaflavin-dependent oxidoreductase (nitroreductase family)
MAYLKPPFFVAKIFNKIAMATGVGGSEKLTVRGRKSGAQQSIPVIPLEFDGARYVISTRGEAQWVLNVRANPTVQISSKKGTANFVATEVPVDARASVIEAYRQKAGKTVEAYWKQLPDPGDHPVFKLTPQG